LERPVKPNLAAMADLRDWLRIVAQAGELQIARGADWALEIGGISELNYRRKPPAALLFDDIKGYPSGHRVLTGSLCSSRRMGITLRLGLELTDEQLVDELRGKPLQWEVEAPDFEPVRVASAPILENAAEPPAIDLTRFPAPFWHEHDGGRYIGTGCIVMTSDPATGAVNGGSYRMQIQEDGRSVTVNALGAKHGGQNIRKWFEREGRAPVLASFGQDPLLLMVGGTEVPSGVSELNYAGAMIGRPLHIVQGEVTGLPIPASSEIAVEGWVYPDRRLPEGPFGEWTGYYSASPPSLAMDIKRLYWRNDPIILGSPAAKPPHDYSYMRTVLKSAMITDALAKAGIPDVRGVWAHECGGGRMLLVVSLRQRYCGHSRQAGFIAAQCQQAAYMTRYVVVVDEDIDPMNLEEVWWAICTRSDPAEDIDVMRKSVGSRVDPILEDRSAPYNSRALIDACKPYERIKSFPRVAQSAPAYLRQLRDKWGDIFADGRFPLPGSALSNAEPDSSQGTGVM
jgi:UbiD family decarboxylase